MARDSAYVFVGYSGAPSRKKGPAKFESPDEDPDRSMWRTGETIAATIKRSFPDTDVVLAAAWSKTTVLRLLAREGTHPRPIRQIHFVCHAGGSGLFLSYRYDKSKRMADAAEAAFALVKPLAGAVPAERLDLFTVMLGLEMMDPLIAGYLPRRGTRYLKLTEPATFRDRTSLALSQIADALPIELLRRRLAEDAYIHLWGCRAGNPFPEYQTITSDSYPVIGRFFALADKVMQDDPALGIKKAGIAIDLARVLQRPCTAAAGDGGLGFQIRDGGRIRITGKKDHIAKPPAWLWRTKNDTWLTYDKHGTKLPNVLMYQRWFTPAQLEPTVKEIGRGYVRIPSWLERAYETDLATAATAQ